MRVNQTKPPIYNSVIEAFDIDESTVVMTYGDHVYTPTGMLTPDLILHEGVHVGQQNKYPGGPDAWWEKYLTDPLFRYLQELEAYRAQYKYIARGVTDRNSKARIGAHLAWQLSSAQYGGCVKQHEAYTDITAD